MITKRPRVIPVLLIHNRQLIKTIKFKNPTYIGDPINAIKIFNEKEVDELIIVDKSCTILNKEPDYDFLKSIASEAFMPIAYGGGIRTVEQIKKILSIGFEKVIINSILENNMDIILSASKIFGSQSIVVSLDVKKSYLGKYSLYFKSGKIKSQRNILDFCKDVIDSGAGEIFINNIDKEGTMSGYDIDLIRLISHSVSVPVIAYGGASVVEDFKNALTIGGVTAIAASSMFIYYGKNKGILITFPDEKQLYEKGVYTK